MCIIRTNSTDNYTIFTKIDQEGPFWYYLLISSFTTENQHAPIQKN